MTAQAWALGALYRCAGGSCPSCSWELGALLNLRTATDAAVGEAGRASWRGEGFATGSRPGLPAVVSAAVAA